MSSSAKKTYLGDYVDFQNGYAFKSSDYTDNGHYLIRIKNVQQGFIEINDGCFVNIPNDAKFEKFKLKNGDIVVSLTGNVGRIARIKDVHLPAVLNQRVASVAPKSEKVLSPEYLYYLLRTPEFLEFAIGSGKGAAQQNISTSDMEKYQVSIPSLEKQAEIVEKLDSAFAEIDLLDENLQLIDVKANELLQSLQSEVLTSIESEWEAIKLGDLGKWITGSTPSTTNKEFWGNEVPFVTPADLSASGELGKIGRQISKLGSEQVRVVTAPSVLLVCIGATLGKVAWTNHTITTNQQINALQVDAKKANTKFAMYLLSNPSMQKMLWDSSTGTTVPILNKGNLESIVVSLPSLEKQNEIVEKLDRLFIEIELLKNKFEFERDKVSMLRQSLLSNVFIPEEAVA